MTDQPLSAPYGAWPSPIAGDVIARDAGWTQSLVMVDGDAVYWSEARPLEDGRDVIVRWHDGVLEDVIPDGWSARTRVHEYGGGAYAVRDGVVYFCRDSDQRVYVGSDPVSPDGARYADLQVTDRGLVCVRERETSPEHTNDLVEIVDGEVRVLASGRDFYSSPRVHGSRIAFLAWDHPRMPWEGCELYVLEDGELTLIAGGVDEAIVQPAWSPSGELYYCSDRTDWWNLYCGDRAITSLEAEVGGPLWEFGESFYAFLDDGRIAIVYSSGGIDHLGLVENGAVREVPLELTRIVDLKSDGTRLVFVGAKPTQTSRVLRLDLSTGSLETLSSVSASLIPEAYVSVPRAVSFPTTGGKTAHAVFYPPFNPDAVAPDGELPPLVVRVHGGPTAHVGSTLRPSIQFLTSRGFAVVDVNYGGSTGYGREYRERLRGTWGVVDVDDCVNCARYLAETGEVDGARMAITGGSAGGWTVLAALCLYPDVFACGADYFGVAELAGMAADTHKFESRYLDYLIPRELWDERSPLNHADKIRAPVIVLQGSEDAVVPPSQSEQIVAALRENGIRCEYLLFEGEQHGFRKAENITRAAEAEFDFYRSIFDR